MHLLNSQYALWIFTAFGAGSLLIIFTFFRKRKLRKKLFSKGQERTLLGSFNPTARFFRTFSLILALFLICFALLDPRWGTTGSDFEMEGIDVVLVMDISQSMNVPDILPSRLEYSKDLATQLISLLVGNRIGISAFAGFGFSVIPLTMDIDAALIFLDELETSMIDMQGTDLQDALNTAIELFDETALTHKAIIVFTDGEDMENSPLQSAKAAEELGITIFTVGVGTPEGSVIPLLDEDGEVTGNLQSDGVDVTSSLNEELLEEIAETTGGSYYFADENTVISLIEEIDRIEKTKFGSDYAELMPPQYQYFLTMGLLFLLIYVFLPDRKIKKRPRISALLAALLLLPSLAHASAASDGYQSYVAGDYEDALTLFRSALSDDPDNEKLLYNEALSLYQTEDYETAAQSFMNLTDTEDENLAQKAWLNLGNSYYQNQNFEAALLAYKHLLNEKDVDAEVYEKAFNNFILTKEQLNEQSQSESEENSDSENSDSDNSEDESSESSEDQEESGSDEEESDSSEEENQQEEQNSGSDSENSDESDSEEQSEAISPSEIEYLLNLIAEEEKDHLSEEQEPDGFMVSPDQNW